MDEVEIKLNLYLPSLYFDFDIFDTNVLEYQRKKRSG